MQNRESITDSQSVTRKPSDNEQVKEDEVPSEREQVEETPELPEEVKEIPDQIKEDAQESSELPAQVREDFETKNEEIKESKWSESTSVTSRYSSLKKPDRLQSYQDSVRNGSIKHATSEPNKESTNLVDGDTEAQVDMPAKSSRKCCAIITGWNWPTITLTLITIGYMLQLLKKVLMLKARKETCSVYCQVKDGPNCLNYVANDYWVLGDECKMKVLQMELVLVIAVIVLLNVTVFLHYLKRDRLLILAGCIGGIIVALEMAMVFLPY